ncbi:SGNH/GDSL hydrolase family protein [Prosthecobacter fluviatilis]|uniref:SGNH/GDSL hydrolase family protein n=1 Tax=Prosthecobacter fluviatilis TaxID=445931 RepID=A0ABW0KUW0_9BACT
MKHHFILAAALLLSPLAALHAANPVTVSVDSPAVVFSPGNWTGDAGRGGKVFRQSWNAGAYFRVTWETTNAKPTARLLLDTSTFPPGFNGPQIAYCIDGVWKSKIPCANEIVIEDLQRAGPHELCVVLQSSQQKERWGSPGKSGLNVLRVTGLQLDAESRPVPAAPAAKWAMIIGDSITEGIGATELSPYSQLLGQALQTQGYEYCINACGWSGWINPGDNPPGDVPGYYVIRNSTHGTGGQYDDAASRWNKIDGNRHSLLDSQGHLSADGQPGHEPALILINYGTNDALHKSNPSDTQASIIQALAALRRSAPEAQIILLIPFGQYYAKELKHAVAAHRQTHPAEKKLALIDLGPGVARSLAVKNGVLGGLHPNDRGHAVFAAKIIPQVLGILNGGR